ncbi:helix-hairpin-helix domain-containing protein [Intestinibacter bartlettii]|uniref:Helix-hairpin-helix domain-containing protein n=1 Tax=Intestinibacter bartlettii TaxID=261299 RepID=A0ABS6DX54_9FIRM|nr:helix-hairpin-helix domain-containing protein [Intestinibacter bartlettii]MBU5336420.1 helix-hairpin-helix domain-containing protein [Intestinibacter bartlettii]
MSITRRGLMWEIINSWWIILSCMGFSFASFIYIGTKTRTTKWKVTGVLYLLIGIISLFIIVTYTEDAISNVAVLVWMLSLLVGLIHSFLVRREYLVRRDYILTNGIEDKDLEEMRENVRKHYKGKDYIKGSGNDTHLDSTYHSNIEYRDYDTVSSKPNDNAFGEYNGEPMTNDENTFENSYEPYNMDDKENEYTSDGSININFCSIDELLSLPGVDEQIANRAISLREMLGGFNSVQEFMDMLHIESQYASQIREKATVKDKKIDLRK